MGWGFKYKTIPGRKPGEHPYTPEDIKRIGWCMKKGIKIAVIPHWEGDYEEWRVELNINRRIHLDPKVYTAAEANKKMYEYYKYYYDKHNKSNK